MRGSCSERDGVRYGDAMCCSVPIQGVRILVALDGVRFVYLYSSLIKN
jgi:hypothetical protein